MRPEATREPLRVTRVDAPGIAAPTNATWSNCIVVGREVAISGVTARGPDAKLQTLGRLKLVTPEATASRRPTQRGAT
jgi:hypothetical protein